MKHKYIFLLLVVVLLQTNHVLSQQTLIMGLPVNRNDENLTEIGSRAEVISVFPVDIKKNILFLEDTLFKIELIDDEFNITKKHLNHRDINSFSFYGINDSNCLILSFLDNDIQGTFTIGNRVYAIETHGEAYYLVQLNHDSMRENCDSIESSLAQTPSQNQFSHDGNEDSAYMESPLWEDRNNNGSGDIKVLVLYTAAAANSVSNIYNTIWLAEEESNQSFANSDINCKIEIVYIGKTDYEEANSTTDKIRFKNNNDGYMDEVHALREKYAADVCVLLAHYNDGICGEAYTIKAQRDEAFCVVKALGCATGYYSFIHEVGHLVGCRHNPENDGSSNPYEFGHGYIYPNGGWRTIMAYNSYCNGCIRKQYWSNPNITYNGIPMGTTDICNNAKVWNIRYGEVGAFENISNNYTITSSTVPNDLNYGFIEASSHVGTNGNVSLQSGQKMAIKAGDEIVFSDGYKASAGSELYAFISQQSATMYATTLLQPSIEVNNVRRIYVTETKNTIVLYPNPTINEIIIQYNGEEQPYEIIIMDIRGRAILKFDNPTDKINMSQIPTGTYFIEFGFKKHSERYKIIKH